MSFQMVLLLATLPLDIPSCFGTMSFQMVLLPVCCPAVGCGGFGTMSFQMVLLQDRNVRIAEAGFGTMSFQMVLLHIRRELHGREVLELCHSRWFYYIACGASDFFQFWNYVIPDGSTTLLLTY